MIVAIDGPAGAGKSSAARGLATRLGFRFLDTGAMYRAVTYAAVLRNLNLEDGEALARLARELSIEVSENCVLLDGQDVTEQIRTFEITSLTRHAADNPEVREHLVHLQQQAAGQDNVVTEGRDQGTVVFPRAECKIFLTASPEERARRRQQDLQRRGEHFDFAEVLARQEARDQRDCTRPVGRLIKADDAIVVNTDGMSPEQVVDELERLVRERMPAH